MKLVEFSSEEFRVRALEIDGEPWFIASEVCDALGHTNARVALQRLDDDEKGVRKVYTLGGEQKVNIINESGLYSLILRSNKPEAKRFKRWVTKEVLPSIRKSGYYEVGGSKAVRESCGSERGVLFEADDIVRMVEALGRSVEAISRLVESSQEANRVGSRGVAVCGSRDRRLYEEVEMIERIIRACPGINQSSILAKMGRGRDDKRLRRVLELHSGIRWDYEWCGREKLYFVRGVEV
jgi:hypothetical protein